MKSILLLLLLFTGVMFSSCQKDVFTDKPEQNQIESEWKYTKEITLKNGANAAFLRICSNYEDSLYSYLEGVDITLVIKSMDENEERIMQTSKILPTQIDQLVNNQEIGNYLFQEPSVIVIHLGANILPDVAAYNISFKPKLLKSYYGPLPIAAHETMGKFLGIVTEDDGGLDMMVTFFHKSSIFSSWTQIATSSLTERPGMNYYFWDFDTYKNRMQVYRDIDDTVYPSYGVHVEVDNFQRTGSNCLIGSYDGATCYVGTPPSGTTAFISSSNKFYYTPVNGNQCPLAGSSFDGANCFVANVPEYAVASVWNNKWYVLSYVTSDLFGKVE